MTEKVNLGPNPWWRFFGNDLAPLANGKVYTFEQDDKVTPKATYQDPDRTTPQTNPIILNSLGEPTAPIYWNYDDGATDVENQYYIEIKDEDDVTVKTIEKYNPALLFPTNPDDTEYDYNYIRNQSFNWWTSVTGMTNTWDVSATNAPEFNIIKDWYFDKSNTTGAHTVSRRAFALGQTLVPFNPRYYFRYACSSAGSGETYKYLAQKLGQIDYLGGQIVTITIYAASTAVDGLSLSWEQNYGTGGSPTAAVITAIPFDGEGEMSTTIREYSVVTTLPEVTSGTLGTDENDFCALRLNFRLNSVTTVDIAQVMVHRGSTNISFLDFGLFEDKARLSPLMQYDTSYIVPALGNTNATNFEDGFVNYANTGGNPNTIGNESSSAMVAKEGTKALFVYLYTNFVDATCPVSGGRSGAGTTIAEAETDFNANKRIALPPLADSVFGGFGTTHAFGSLAGADSVVLAKGNIPAHVHTYDKINTNIDSHGAGTTTNIPNTFSSTNTGDGTADGLKDPPDAVSVIQPTFYGSFRIKL